MDKQEQAALEVAAAREADRMLRKIRDDKEMVELNKLPDDLVRKWLFDATLSKLKAKHGTATMGDAPPSD